MSRETLISEGRTYARKQPGESFRAYACAFCRHLISYTTVQPKRNPEMNYLGIHCARCGYALPRRACPLFAKRYQPKRRGLRK